MKTLHKDNYTMRIVPKVFTESIFYRKYFFNIYRNNKTKDVRDEYTTTLNAKNCKGFSRYNVERIKREVRDGKTSFKISKRLKRASRPKLINARKVADPIALNLSPITALIK